MTAVDTAKIAETAYLIWLEEGCPEGRDLDHWLRAQEALNTMAKPGRKAAAKKAATKPKAAKAAAATADKPKPAAKPRARKTAAKTTA